MGDEFGNIMTLEINSNDLSSNNTVPDIMDPNKKLVDYERFKSSIIKKKIHDEAVTKVLFLKQPLNYQLS
jgi:hypothetical protein